MGEAGGCPLVLSTLSALPESALPVVVVPSLSQEHMSNNDKAAIDIDDIFFIKNIFN
jgi:hypothetical protein